MDQRHKLDEAPASAKQEFARGWSVLLGALVCYMVSIVAIPTYTSGVYLKDLTAEFGVGRGELGSAMLLTTVIMMIMAPTVGILSDRFGMRIPIGVSLIGMAVVYVLQGTVMDSFLDYVVLTGCLTAVGAATLPVVFTKAVNAWFDRARGLALGCVLIGTGVTAVIGPPLLTQVIVPHGWRAGYLATAAVVLLMTPLVVWLVRMPPWTTRTGSVRTAAGDSTLGQALRTRHFWMMAVAFALQVTAAVGLAFNLIPMLTDSGVSPAKAASIFSICGLAITCGRFVMGPLMDHVFVPWLASALAAIFGAGCLLLAFGGLGWAPISAFAIGFVLGAEVDFIGFLASRYFGLTHYGRIYGWLYSAFAVGAGVSGTWVGEVFDRTGSYDIALMISAALTVPVITLLLLLPRYSGRPARVA